MSVTTIDRITTLAQLKDDALQAGVTVASRSAPGLNGTYSVILPHRIDAQHELEHLKMTGSGAWPRKHPAHVDIRKKPPPNRTAFFRKGILTKRVIDASGVLHEFTVEQYRVFGEAIIAYEDAVRKAYKTAVLNNAEFVAPSNHVTIEQSSEAR